MTSWEINDSPLSPIRSGGVCVLGSSCGLMESVDWVDKSGACRLQHPVRGGGGQACLQESCLLACNWGCDVWEYGSIGCVPGSKA